MLLTDRRLELLTRVTAIRFSLPLNALATKTTDAQLATLALRGYAKYNLNQNFKPAVLSLF